MAKNVTLLDKNRTGLIVIDIQKKLIKKMQDPELLVANACKLIEGFKILERPIFLTEQNPKGLGKTETAVKKALKNVEVIEKMSFSCCGVKGFVNNLCKQKINQIVLCGIEAHVCIWQTALDLLANNFQVVVVKDGVSSRNDLDKETLLNQMRINHIQVSTTETVLFELLKSAESEAFEKISELIK
jgi:nicotinamidase-related amidase